MYFNQLRLFYLLFLEIYIPSGTVSLGIHLCYKKQNEWTLENTIVCKLYKKKLAYLRQSYSSLKYNFNVKHFETAQTFAMLSSASTCLMKYFSKKLHE